MWYATTVRSTVYSMLSMRLETPILGYRIVLLKRLALGLKSFVRLNKGKTTKQLNSLHVGCINEQDLLSFNKHDLISERAR